MGEVLTIAETWLANMARRRVPAGAGCSVNDSGWLRQARRSAAADPMSVSLFHLGSAGGWSEEEALSSLARPPVRQRFLLVALGRRVP